ncbi:MAG: protein YgfX [Sulfuricaulis sp.]
MLQKSEINLILNIKVSRLLAGIFLATHLGGILLVVVTPMAWPVRLVLWGVLGWSLYYSLVTHAWRTSRLAIAAIELDNEGVASVRFAGSESWQPVRITSRFVHPWLTLMTLRLEGRRWPVNLVIAADAVEPEPFRRWRVALKFQVVPG